MAKFPWGHTQARAKTIKVSVTKNEEAGQISQLNDEVARLKKLLATQVETQRARYTCLV